MNTSAIPKGHLALFASPEDPKKPLAKKAVFDWSETDTEVVVVTTTGARLVASKKAKGAAAGAGAAAGDSDPADNEE